MYSLCLDRFIWIPIAQIICISTLKYKVSLCSRLRVLISSTSSVFAAKFLKKSKQSQSVKKIFKKLQKSSTSKRFEVIQST